MQSRGTRCYQMKHNAKIVAPHAAQLKELTKRLSVAEAEVRAQEEMLLQAL